MSKDSKASKSSFRILFWMIFNLLSFKRYLILRIIIIASGIIFVVFHLKQASNFMPWKYTLFGVHFGREEFKTDEGWKEMRRNLLSRQEVSKVIILAHARGGSTICSDVFNIETNNTILWYEALHGFHSYYSGLPPNTLDTDMLYHQNLTRRVLDPLQREALTNYLTQLMQCDISNLPTELLAIFPFIRKSTAFGRFGQCMESHKASEKYKRCEALLHPHCYFYEFGIMPIRNGDLLSSHAKCADILRILRRRNISIINTYTHVEMLHRFLNEHRAEGLKEITTCAETTMRNSRPSKLPLKVLTDEESEEQQQCTNLIHKFFQFVQHYDCFRNLTEETQHCRWILDQICRSRKLTVAEIQRTFLADLEPLIKQMPDIHIVHYVRDPRAVSVSRAEKHLHTFRRKGNWTAVDECVLLCARMRYDSQHKDRLQKIYPDSIITVRYEDLVTDPVNTVTKMYEYFGRPVPRGLKEWVERRMHAKKDDGMYGVSRMDGKSHLSNWSASVTKNGIDIMNEQCRDILMLYDYNF